MRSAGLMGAANGREQFPQRMEGSMKSALRTCAKINTHFGGSAGQADARRGDAAMSYIPPWLCSSLAPRQRACGRAAKWEVIFAQALSRRLWFLLLFSLLALPTLADPATEALVKQIAQKVKQNVDRVGEYGFFQNLIVTKFGGDEEAGKRDDRTYHTIWVRGQSYNELLQIDHRVLSGKERQDELKRFAGFVKSVQCKKTTGGVQQELKSIPWWEVPEKYDFKRLPPEGGAAVVLSFRPKQASLEERCRFERILNHLQGTVWLDEELNVMKVQASLTEPVHFGLGIIANVESAQIKYAQQQHGSAWLPSSLSVRWSARFALLSHRRQEIQVNWYDPYPRYDEPSTSVVMKRIPAPSVERVK